MSQKNKESSDNENGSPSSKRPRLDNDSSLLLLCKKLWSYWQAYLDSDEEDTDELTELVRVANENKSDITKQNMTATNWQTATPVDLLPILVSAAALIIDKQREAVEWWPDNPAAWLAALLQKNSANARAYRHVAQQAQWMRKAALVLLEKHQHDDEDENDSPTMVDMLQVWLVHGMGVENIESDDDEAEEGDEEASEEGGSKKEDDGCKTNDGEKEEKTDSKDDDRKEQSDQASEDTSLNIDDMWSFSIVESTARTMAATLFSLEGKHDLAATELKHVECTHRVHPHVWDKQASTTPNSANDVCITKEPAVIKAPVLPGDVFKTFAQAFAPDASFWKDTNYAQRDYYSFYSSRLQPDEQPTNLIQDIIESYLLPMVEQTLSSTSPSIVGYEWWAHTRSVADHLGHNLHFDTDEAMLNTKHQIEHPLVSSIMYLEAPADQNAGATIVFNQTSHEDAPLASQVWKNTPHVNSCFVFPGNLLHGVLPCKGSHQATRESAADDDAADDSAWKGSLEESIASAPSPPVEHHRTSFMVGYWTRPCDAATSEDDDDSMYGPCHPLPTSEPWVKALQVGYPSPLTRSVSTVACEAVPHVSPAWQELEKGDDTLDRVLPPIPPAVDHQYFVYDPATHFRDCLVSGMLFRMRDRMMGEETLSES